MHRYDEPSPESSTRVSITRVPTAALTRALAEIEVRRARQAFEQAGTITIAEALQETGVEATQEEVAEEIERVREADAEVAARQKRRRCLWLILRAESTSLLLCGLALLSLSRTIYHPQWQASHQKDRFRDSLRMTQGPDPRVQIDLLPDGLQPALISEAAARRGSSSHAPAYPLSALPDGYNIHHYNGIDDDGQLILGGAPSPMTFPAYFDFRQAEQPHIHETVSVYYGGRLYQRGWISKADVPKLLHGQPCVYYPEPIDDPQIARSGLIPLTIAMQSIQEAQAQWSQTYPAAYGLYTFQESSPGVELDGHAWEKF